MRAAGLDDRQRPGDILLAVHRALYVGIEILHAQARAVEAGVGEFGDVVGRELARIQFDGDVAVGLRAEAEVVAQVLHRRAQLRRREEVRRAAAEMQLHDLAIGIEQARHHADLARQPRAVGLASRAVARDHAIAAAVEARTGAERDVDVERQAGRNRIAIAAPHRFAQLVGGEVGTELGRGGIGGVARAGPVVAAEKFGGEKRSGRHAREPIDAVPRVF